MVSRALLLCALLFLAADASAEDFYVDPAAAPGGDGSVENPFDRIPRAMAAVQPGDRVLLAPGVYQRTVAVTAYGNARRAVLVLRDGVEVIGAGRGLTILRAPATDGAPIFGVTAEGVTRSAILRDLTIDGPCFHGINLREASPTLDRIDILNDVTGSSSVGLDARDGSDPFVRDVRVDGGHGALFVEFGSRGTFIDCTIGSRPDDGIALSNGNPTLIRCLIEFAGRDALVLNQGSRPVFEDCEFAGGARWAVRVAGGYSAGSRISLGGNRWFSDSLPVLEASILDAADDPGLRLRVEVLPLGGIVTRSSASVGELKSDYR
jgi:hypothetical protein